jgi:hypothetical protein
MLQFGVKQAQKREICHEAITGARITKNNPLIIGPDNLDYQFPEFWPFSWNYTATTITMSTSRRIKTPTRHVLTAIGLKMPTVVYLLCRKHRLRLERIGITVESKTSTTR